MPSSAPSEINVSRREQNKRDKLNRIIAAARALFHSRGYDGTTTQQIAKAARIATGTLFLYANSKEDLLVLVFHQEMSELIESTYEDIDRKAPAKAQVLQLFQGFIDYHADDVEIARALIRELTFLSNPERVGLVNTIAAAIHSKLYRILEDAQRAGEIDREANLDLLPRVLLSVYYQQLQSWLGRATSLEQFKASLEETVAYLLEHTAHAASDTPKTTR